MRKDIIEATLRLFKAVYTEENTRILSGELLSEATSKGLIFDKAFVGSNDKEQSLIVDSARHIYGKNLFELNNTFHKTWKTVEEIDPALHYLQQVLHYITTYGFDTLGIPYDSTNTYIPAEIIPMPEGAVPYNFTVIRMIDRDELVKRINTLLEAGVALSSQQVTDIVLLINALNIDVDFNSIKNKEVKTILWLKIEDKPYIDVDEFLRALTYEVSGDTLILRSYRNHRAIKLYMHNPVKQKRVAELLEMYVSKFGMENVAGQYLRNRMLFLAFKCETTKRLINQINRNADLYHKPKEEKHLSEDDILEANIFQLVKYWNYCNSMIHPTEDKLYQIRNGRNYLAENNNYGITGRVKQETTKLFRSYKSLIEFRMCELLKHLQDKILIIPDYIDYKIPSSLKRLCSGVPEGTTIYFGEEKPFVVGVHWKNHEKHRVDLDLHATSLDGSYGWNHAFRAAGGEVLYSGDMTDAPIDKNGASEAFRFSGKIEHPFIVTLNDFTQLDETDYQFVFDVDCPYDFKTSSRSAYGSIFSKNARTLNAKITKGRGQNTLGVVLNGKFYFMNSSIFSGAVTQRSELLLRLIAYYEQSQSLQLSMKTLAAITGLRIFTPDEFDNYKKQREEIGLFVEQTIDLSLEAITEDTFPTLFTEPE